MFFSRRRAVFETMLVLFKRKNGTFVPLIL